jgi:hypothetical protein
VELARVTHTRIPKREPFTHSLVPAAKAQRAAMRSLNTTVPKICQYVRWSEVLVQWSPKDHPEHIPDGYYAMV